MNEPDAFDLAAKQHDANEKARNAQRVERDDLVWLMSGKRGRRVVYRQLERAGVWRSSFNTDAMQMAFNEGMRNEGLALTAKLMAYCPTQYAEMTTENLQND